MRVRGLAFIGLVVGAFLASPSSTVVSATAVSSPLASSNSLDRFFSSDAPESLHEAKNQGTADEPKAWPEANAWLHAQLSETEREFLSLSVTGTVNSGADHNGGLTSAQLADTTGVVAVTLRFYRSSSPSTSQLQADIVAGVSGSTTASVSVPTTSVTNVGNSFQYHFVTFQFTQQGSVTAGQQYRALTDAFATSGSSLRSSTSFQDIDLSYFPAATFSTNGGGGNQPYCTKFPTTCLNGATCVNGVASPTTTYTCTCASGYIGPQCQFSLFSQPRRNKLQSGSVARGRSVTRPNAVLSKPMSAQ